MTYRTHESPDAEQRTDEWWRYYIDQWHRFQCHAEAEAIEL